jgi:predicted site-specific integrase-resolvase
MYMEEKFYFTGEVAHICKVNPQTVRNWIKTGKLQVSMFIGGKTVIAESALAEFNQKRTNKIESQLNSNAA